MVQKLQQSIVPVPDPTILTTQSLLREVAALKEFLETRINSVESITKLHADSILKRDLEVKDAIMHLQALLEEKIKKHAGIANEVFSRIDVQFIERDKRTEQLAIASSTAIAAALQAAKEAVGAQNTSNSIAISKSETSTLESLRQLRDLFQVDSRATNDKINDIKSRIDKGEGQHTGSANVWGIILGGGSFIIALTTLFILIFRHL